MITTTMITSVVRSGLLARRPYDLAQLELRFDQIFAHRASGRREGADRDAAATMPASSTPKRATPDQSVKQ